MKINKGYVNNVFLVLIILLLLILDNSFMPFISIRGAFPSLLFTFCIAYSIIRGKNQAIAIGVAAGLLQDIFFYNGLGVNALSNMLVCLLAAMIGENIYKDKKLIPVFSVLALTVLKVCIIYGIFRLSALELNISTALLSAVYNALIMVLGYNLVFKLYDNEKSKISWRFK